MPIVHLRRDQARIIQAPYRDIDKPRQKARGKAKLGSTAAAESTLGIRR
jgi:hypothetical protein